MAVRSAWSFNRTGITILILSVCIIGHTLYGEESSYSVIETEGDSLWNAFVEPPAEARPFVRWWWNGLRIDEQEILRELDVLKKAGIGGFEINPIAQPDGSILHDEPELEWLSQQWCHLVQVTVEQARLRGMIPDIIVGSGWPFGAEFLQSDQWTQRLNTGVIHIEGPGTFKFSRKELLSKVASKDARSWPDAPPVEIKYLCLASVAPGSVNDLKDVTNQLSGDTLALEVPAGNHLLHIGGLARGFSKVHHGALGAKGPVLDHYNAAAVGDFLGKMSDALNPFFGGKFGGPIRAVFCDSIELSAANWTDEFNEEFQKRAGYDIRPWIPLILDFNNPPEVAPEFRESVCRARYDYCRVLVELFRERFIHTFHNWCKTNNALSRYQAYGSPWLVGMLEGFMVTDIPESNNWIHKREQNTRNHRGIRKHGFLVWSKYAASAGHLADKRIISTEAHTNLRAVFQLDLETLKIADDLNFVMGINHSVLHGFNYSPLKAGFPGWLRYGTYFSEQNTWWPFMPKWSNYNARLSAVFQETKPVVPIAVMAPRADIWQNFGLNRKEFHTQPFYANQLWEKLSNCGVHSDYISEISLTGSTAKGGQLCIGPAAYNAIILAGVQTLEPESAETLLKFVEAGGHLVFVEHEPSRSPGLNNAAKNDHRVRVAIDSIIDSGDERVIKIAAPKLESDFLAWTARLLNRLDLPRALNIKTSDPDVFITQRQCSTGRPLLFFSNQSNQRKQIDLDLNFPGQPWRWDPDSGTRSPVLIENTLTLDPYESLLLVFEGKIDGQAARICRAPVENGRELVGSWNAKFIPHFGKPFERQFERLSDLGKSSDKALNTFAGTVVYTTSFTVDGPLPRWLDLGAVYDISELCLNGKSLGVKWYGRHTYDVLNAVQKGNNELEIKVTTVLFNHARTLRDNPTAVRWIDKKKAEKTVPAGLAGLVRLIEE